MEFTWIRILLLIGAGLAVAEGIIMFIGGLVAAHDASDKHLEWDKTVNSPRFQCGLIEFGDPPTSDFKDRGWFQRVQRFKKDDPDWSTLPRHVDKDEINKLFGYRGVVTIAVVCGVAWVAGGVLLFLAAFMQIKITLIISLLVFIISYVLFICLFAAVWDSVRGVVDDCDYFEHNKDAKRQGTKSSREFLAYSILGFILIAYCIAVEVVAQIIGGVFSDEAEQQQPQETANKDLVYPKQADPSQVLINEEEKRQPPPPPAVQQNAPKAEYRKLGPNPYRDQFKSVNKFINDEPGFNGKIDKKFKKLDTDNSQKMALEEFKKYINNYFSRKKLPQPKEAKIKGLMNKYDTDKSGTLEKPEFAKLYSDLYWLSRTSLIGKYSQYKHEKYIDVKAGSFSTNQKDALKNDLRTIEGFYVKVVKPEMDRAGITATSMAMQHLEQVCGAVARKYQAPEMNPEELKEIINDMGRGESSICEDDLKILSFCVMKIALKLMMK